jgi:hypothetical protein
MVILRDVVPLAGRTARRREAVPQRRHAFSD